VIAAHSNKFGSSHAAALGADRTFLIRTASIRLVCWLLNEQIRDCSEEKRHGQWGCEDVRKPNPRQSFFV
jgi:hypothetical protein